MQLTFTDTHQPRIMMYSQDGFGLGHMRRTTSIAHQILRSSANASVLTLADSPLGQFFEAVPNQDYIKLPSVVKAGPGDWRAVNLNMPFEAVHSMRQQLIRSAVLGFRPHVLLVDHMPHGAMGELIPTLEALRESGADTKVVLGLRDILDSPEVVRRRWSIEGAYEAIERYYDRVLIYGSRDVFDMTEQYGFSPAVSERLRYCGYVCTPLGARYAARARSKYIPANDKETKLIVVQAGGGADAYPMMKTFLEALPAIAAQRRVAVAVITGPFMPQAQRRDLQNRARGLPASVSMTVSDTISYTEAADLVVSMAGYNTTMEVLRSGKPAIIIPRAGPSAEQRTRTRLFAANGWLRMIDPDDMSAELVASTVLDNLDWQPAASGQRPNLSGLQIAADELLSLIPTASETIAPAMLELGALQPVAA